MLNYAYWYYNGAIIIIVAVYNTGSIGFIVYTTRITQIVYLVKRSYRIACCHYYIKPFFIFINTHGEGSFTGNDVYSSCNNTRLTIVDGDQKL